MCQGPTLERPDPCARLRTVFCGTGCLLAAVILCVCTYVLCVPHSRFFLLAFSPSSCYLVIATLAQRNDAKVGCKWSDFTQGSILRERKTRKFPLSCCFSNISHPRRESTRRVVRVRGWRAAVSPRTTIGSSAIEAFRSRARHGHGLTRVYSTYLHTFIHVHISPGLDLGLRTEEKHS